MQNSEDQLLKKHCPDFLEWPESWQGVPEDITPGKKILKMFKPFMASLIRQGLAKKTLRRHFNNLWTLGGELIRDLNMDESLRSRGSGKLLAESVSEDGGPYCRHLTTPEELRAFDATCRKFHKHLRGLK